MIRAALLGAFSALFVVCAIVVFGDGCSPTTTQAVQTDLGPSAKCALPIVVNGLLSGQPVQAIIDLAMQCGGMTIAGLIALVSDLEAAPPVDAGVPPAPAAMSQYRLGLAQLHAALLAKQAAGSP